MSEINDGGPAFPGETWGSKGMSLRDYFAACARESDVKRWMEIYLYNGMPITEEEAKYACADAMIAARKAVGRDKQEERAKTDGELSDAEIIAALFSHISQNGDKLELFEEATWAYGRIWATLAPGGGKRISSDAVDVICCGGLLTFRQGGVRELRSLNEAFWKECLG